MTNFLSPSSTFECLSATPEAIAVATGVFVADILGADASAVADQAPEWIKIAPRGRFTARDGRSFEVNPEVLAARFESDKVAVVVDLDHATAKKAPSGEAAPAHGWIEKMEPRADGLYGKVEWLPAGKAVLAARTHRYVSPTVPHTDTGLVTWIHSVALVAAPALSMPAIASAASTTQETPPMTLAKIATLLALNVAADETACLSAITTLQARVDPAVHQATLDALSAKTTELDTLSASIRKEKVDALLDGAVKNKQISPAQRESYAVLCATDAGFAEVTKLVATLGAGLAPSGLDDKPTPGGMATLSAEDRLVCKQLGITEEEFRKANGLTAA